MKSRTSFFNPTVFKKNLTRFAPLWIVYCLGLLMLLTAVVEMDTDYIRSLNVASALQGFAVIHLGYALLVVQLLFGDLYNARLCNALHAMPLRRECWFCTNAASGIVFALVPTAVFSLILLPMLGSGWSVALWFLLGTTLQYLFFFGVAVFSVMLSGNRFAQVLVYGLINFVAILVYWFAGTLYEPLMYGVTINPYAFTIWCPVYSMMEADLITVTRTEILLAEGRYDYPGTVAGIAPCGDWWYLVVCAVIGIALIIAALALYRRRQLETAGDFMAVKAVEPVFLALFTLGVGAVFQLFGRMFDNSLEYLFLALGLVVGFYAGRMLLMRTTRVFQPRSLLGLAGIAAALVLSIVLIAVDAFGIVRYMPDAEDVKSVSFSNNYGYRVCKVEEPEEIETLMDIHEYALGNIPDGWYGYDGYTDYYNGIYYTYFNLTYELKDGSSLTRRYTIPVESEPGRILKDYYSDLEYVLGISEDELKQAASWVNSLYIDGEGYYYEDFEEGALSGLLEAIAADCKAGNMVQDWSYHANEDSQVYIEMEFRYAEDHHVWRGMYVYESCENTRNWLEENGYKPGEGLYGG